MWSEVPFRLLEHTRFLEDKTVVRSASETRVQASYPSLVIADTLDIERETVLPVVEVVAIRSARFASQDNMEPIDKTHAPSWHPRFFKTMRYLGPFLAARPEHRFRLKNKEGV